jgi:hypothetical protein
LTLRLAKRSGPLPLSLGVVGLVAACYCSPFRAAWTASPGIALLIAGLTTAADLFSVFVGPAKAIVERAAPALDYLLLIFPTFGYPLGFALSVTDSICLASSPP